MAGNRYPGFSNDARKLIYEAEALGWTFRVTKNGHAFGKSPDGTTTINIPKNLSRANRSQQNCEADLRRWEREQQGALGKAVGVSDAFRSAAEKKDDDPISDDVMVGGMVKHLVSAGIDADKPIPALPSLVSVKPWMAKKNPRSKGGGMLYESGTTLERKWSDGTTDYICAFPDCDYVNPRPRSVAMHYAGTHSRTNPVGRASQENTVFTPEYEPSDVHFTKGYQPSERLLSALTEALRGSGATEPEGLAYAALVWVHERPDLDDQEARQPREPMTPEEVLAKIRALVGQPFAARVEALEAEQAALQERYTLLEKEAVRLREERAALRELLD